MSQNNLLQSYNWEAQYEDGQVQFTRPIQEEVISVYEVYVKEEETVGGEARADVEAGSNDAIRLPERIDRMMSSRFPASLTTLSTGPTGLVFEADCMDLEAAIDSEVISLDGTVSKLISKDSIKYKILEDASNVSEENSVVVYSHPAPLSAAVQTSGLVAGIGVNDNGSSVGRTVTLSNLAPSLASSSLVSVSPSLPMPAPTTLPSTSTSTSTSATATRLIDKDDPRSRLHFVKYLKREGKTLKIWECGICSKEFRHQYTLMRHLPTHTDERNFKCDACGKAFRQLSTLSQHKAIHSDARPYVCEFCKKTFNRVSTLISHRKTHSEHKPHKCHLCGKGFHQKGNLRNHVFTHTNERPYKCELCGKGFNQMSNLVCHKVKAHAHAEKMQYACGICGKEFPRRFSLRSHEEYKHGIKYRQPGGVQSVPAANLNQGSNLKIVHASGGSGGESECSAGDSNARGLGLDKSSIHRLREGSNVLSMFEYTGGEEVEGMPENTVVGRIGTKAMESALLQGQTPFALFKPLKGIPVLVKVSPSGTDKHVLTAATAEDLRLAGKITLDSSLNLSDLDGLKAVQIKVPVVATITQSIDTNGKLSFLVEAPTSGLDLEKDGYVECGAGALITEPMEAHLTYSEETRAGDVRTPAAALEQIELDRVTGKGVAEAKRRFRMKLREKDNKDGQKEREAITSGGSEEVLSVLSGLPGGPEVTEEPEEPGDCDNELLELAAQGGIQFVRATEDGRYEVMSNSEARDLMAQNSHDMTILDGKDAESIGFLDIRTTHGVATAVSGCDVADQVLIGDIGQQIMLLDSGSPPRASPLQVDDIEILENKDIRVLESRSTNIEERLADGIAFLPHSKIGELMLEPRDLSLDVDGVSVVEADKEGQWSEYNILCSVLLNDVVCSVERGAGGTCGAGAHHLRYHQHHHHLYQQQNQQHHHHHHHNHHNHQHHQHQQHHHHHQCHECSFPTDGILGEHAAQSSVSTPNDNVDRDVSINNGVGNEELPPEYRVPDEKEYIQMGQQSPDEFDVRRKLSELASVLNLQSVQEESISVLRNRSQIKILGGREQDISRILPNSTERARPKLASAGGSNQIKILGAKKHQSPPSRRNLQRNEGSAEHAEDDLGLSVDNVVTIVERKNVKILGRRLERVALPENETLKGEKGTGRLGGEPRNEDPSKKRQEGRENLQRSSDPTEGMIIRSIRESVEDVQDVQDVQDAHAARMEESLVGQATRAHSSTADFLLRACSPCPADFLNFEAQDSESSAEAVDCFERHCQREREFVMTGLPDLD